MLSITVHTRFDGNNDSLTAGLLGIKDNEALFLDDSRRDMADGMESAH